MSGKCSNRGAAPQWMLLATAAGVPNAGAAASSTLLGELSPTAGSLVEAVRCRTRHCVKRCW
jgi:hypothetical protein